MTEVPSPLIGKPAPQFTLPLLYEPDKTLSGKDLLGKPYLLNVFGSWCPTCQYEHPILTGQIKPLGIKLIGLDWKDEPEDAKRWIAQFGNPYDAVITDRDGRAGIDFGVYMAPETVPRRCGGRRPLQAHRHVHAGEHPRRTAAEDCRADRAVDEDSP